MKKTELIQVVAWAKEETKNALQLVYDSLNRGQQNKLLNNNEVKKLFDLYGVNY